MPPKKPNYCPLSTTIGKSIHLAAAEAISLQIMPQTLVFACFDKHLNESAKILGMMVLN
ncbi:MAG: hypothetical protein WBM66_11745 [Thiothrix litoralis]|jgi:hypothetical protein